MLEPWQANVPSLFLFLVVLPLVVYVLLGKWGEATNKRERVNLLAQLAAEEARRAEAMAVADVIPPVSPSKNVLHLCARCFNPATTRCARCKSVRYCSGKCQIIHWREVHKQECQQLETASSSSSPVGVSIDESIHKRFLFNESMASQCFGYNVEQNVMENEPIDNIACPSVSIGVPGTIDCSAIGNSQVPMLERRSTEKRASRKSNREMLRRKEEVAFNSPEEVSGSRAAYSVSSNHFTPKEVPSGHKLRNNDPFVSEGETPLKHNVTMSDVHGYGQATSRCTMLENDKYQSQYGNKLESRSHCGVSCSPYSLKNRTNVHETEMDIQNGGGLLKAERTPCNETVEFLSSESTAMKGSVKAKRPPYSLGTKNSKSPKSAIKETGEQNCSETEKGQVAEETKFSKTRDTTSQNNGVANPRIMKMMGLKKKTKLTRQHFSEAGGDRCRIKMLFPYKEFVKFFQCEVFDLSPRGLLNCGNSCYANAVLQCLTCTKPLIIYLLHRSHSRACCGKDWCLMCELEQYVILLQEGGGPMSPSRILLHMRSINCHIGDGSQEDAHEFLRLLVTSMQSICLEGLGGENKVDPRLQETTFIQHTFGGHLRSKVKCLRCQHESERYENFMDLTLEIFGWVESLEDALTQFTTPEDLDGENMYRCGRCATYVQARKQLRIQEAPNILTIVLKRFQVQRVPMSQVMSEEAYILFYMRSWPRPQIAFTGSTIQNQVPEMAGCSLKVQKPSRPGQSKPSSSQFVCPGRLPDDHRPETTKSFTNHDSNGIRRSANRNVMPAMETYADPIGMEFSDATSSDWSLFTSSDEASFTTESTRDSFSTVDYADNADPVSSLFHTIYAPDYSRNSVSCRKFSNSKPYTGFVSQEKGQILNSYLSTQPLDRVPKGQQVSGSPTEFSSDSNYDMYVRYGSNPIYGLDQTSSHCKL
ncbi:ubiquitin carboxyl-terminal hydrolase 15 isoform X2 [Ziziphus jujuba]|uniref:Ubiquitin carboxyl-terminal hydrolase 15 isoform X2 n=1 Tax=Ziziphus jujuba TaxID=326968 RepID=A0ABM3ZX22_ZIZJJ|nr:ubiquitin carboxyl-terminal hydrolase 15 isoform X2 [Ziziphus jujuba]